MAAVTEETQNREPSENKNPIADALQTGVEAWALVKALLALLRDKAILDTGDIAAIERAAAGYRDELLDGLEGDRSVSRR